MFDDLDQVDWAGLNAHEVPTFIRGLVSEDSAVRNASFDELLDTYIYERPDLARAVVPYILRILRNQDVNAETELLIEFLRAMHINAQGFATRGMEIIEDSRKIITDIDDAVDVFRKLSEDSMAKDAADHIISEIEGK